MIARDEIVAVARGWLGTPYHHQASLRGIGCDCLGLIRGLWRELEGPKPEPLPAYTRDWGDATGVELLMEAGCRHLLKLDDLTRAEPGDVLVFRMQSGVAKHAGILACTQAARSAEAQKEAWLIHAREEIGVVEVPLTRWWRRRVVAAFRFPGVN